MSINIDLIWMTVDVKVLVQSGDSWMYIPQNMVINCEAYSNRDGSIPIPCPKTDHLSRGLNSYSDAEVTRNSDKVLLAPNFWMDHDGSICSSTSNWLWLCSKTLPAGCLGGSSAKDWWRHSWMMKGKHSWEVGKPMVNGGLQRESPMTLTLLKMVLVLAVGLSTTNVLPMLRY